jgi:imidazoleglycerol phosphate synthase glutamine amidotransferase subunit HisH
VSAVACGRLLGVQFHPERSGTDGLRLLANVVGLVRSGVTGAGMAVNAR